jgi:hypothetical protein
MKSDKHIINGKEITTKYNNQNDKYLFDFPFIIDQINSHYIKLVVSVQKCC